MMVLFYILYLMNIVNVFGNLTGKRIKGGKIKMSLLKYHNDLQFLKINLKEMKPSNLSSHFDKYYGISYIPVQFLQNIHDTLWKYDILNQDKLQYTRKLMESLQQTPSFSNLQGFGNLAQERSMQGSDQLPRFGNSQDFTSNHLDILMTCEHEVNSLKERLDENYQSMTELQKRMNQMDERLDRMQQKLFQCDACEDVHEQLLTKIEKRIQTLESKNKPHTPSKDNTGSSASSTASSAGY